MCDSIRNYTRCCIAQNFDCEKFDELSMSETLTIVPFIGKVLTGKILVGKTLMSRLPFVKIHQTFPPSKFCAIRHIHLHTIFSFFISYIMTDDDN